ncbi:RsfA family transcriptional regulator [Paenibacillus sp. FSL P4-0176]|uniref:RsfA family transcriptional regulator n=1 Tax=Paenibacillus sp. FSL P4-0176 TaxID=2921631 RepID=UPI0030D351E1
MVRKDNWTADDDQLLATTILTNIASGKTQLSAFTDVGEKLSRTSAACGFRWNSNVRHKYKEAIANAKTEKLNSKLKSASTFKDNTFSFDGAITYLLAAKDELQRLNREKEVIAQKIQNVSLEIEIKRSEMTSDTMQNTQALAMILSKAADLGLFERNKKPAI